MTMASRHTVDSFEVAPSRGVKAVPGAACAIFKPCDKRAMMRPLYFEKRLIV
jgi:hypothetical protein